MPTEEEIYGGSFPLVDKLRLLAEWAPLIGRLQSVMSASSPHEQALAITKTLQWAAGKSGGTTVDDEAAYHLEAILKSPEGKAFFDWVVQKVTQA